MVSGEFLATLAREILKQGKRVRFMVRGSSMQPFIRGGDIVEVEPADIHKLREGDVVFYTRPDGRVILHRVIAKRREDAIPVLTCQGDAAVETEGPIYPNQILGRAVSVFRGKRKRRLNSGGNRFLGRIWAHLSPHRPFLVPFIRFVWSILRHLGTRKLICDG